MTGQVFSCKHYVVREWHDTSGQFPVSNTVFRMPNTQVHTVPNVPFAYILKLFAQTKKLMNV
jgi:hypothetical protein